MQAMENSSEAMDALHVRAAGQRDSAILFAWRNDPSTRSASLNTAEISWNDHNEWFTASLVATNRHILIIEKVSPGSVVSLGMCRFDVNLESVEISINLDPVMRGKGLALGVLRSAINHFWNTDPGNADITARVRRENIASCRLFERAGFSKKSSDGAVYIFDLKKPDTL